MCICQAPLPADGLNPAPLTPKRGVRREDSLGQASSYCAAPSPDGDHLLSVNITPASSSIDDIVSQTCRILAGQGTATVAAPDTPGSVGAGTFWGDPADSSNEERLVDEHVLENVPASPVWPDMQGGTGVRRRISPRAGNRSPRRGVGWSPISPPRQAVSVERGGRSTPQTLAFDDETSPRGRFCELRIDVGARDEKSVTGVLGGLLHSSSENVFAEAETPLAGAGRAKAAAAAGAVVAVGATGTAGTPGVSKVVHTDVDEMAVRQVGLKCSSPIYDRGKNLLGSSHSPKGGEREAVSPRRRTRGSTGELCDVLMTCCSGSAIAQ